MKSIKFIALMLFSFVIASCSKNNDNSVTGDAVLKFTVSQDPIPVKQIANFAVNKTANGPILNSSTPVNEGMYFDTFTDEIDLNLENPLSQTSKSEIHKFAKEVSPLNTNMENGVKYRILLYNKKDSKFVVSVEATAGQELLIPVVKNEEYLWYAYSFNSKGYLPEPSNNDNPSIQTPIETELLHASGTASSAGGNTPFTIVFKHQLTQIFTEIDVQEYYGVIDYVNIHFANKTTVNKGDFNIRSTEITKVEPIDVDRMNFVIDPTHRYRANAKYFVAEPSHLKSFSLRFDQVSVIRNSDQEKVDLFTKSITQEFKGYTPYKGKLLVARAKLWKKSRKLTILHAQGLKMNTTNVTNGGHAAGHGASYNFLKNPKAFGVEANSIVKVDGFNHLYANGGNGALARELLKNPDIVIFGEEYHLSDQEEIQDLENYVQKGGVLLMFSDLINSSFDKQLNLLERLLGKNLNYGYPAAGKGNQGYKYQFKHIDDIVLNGPFGDVRGKYWGADLGRTVHVNANANNVIEYSNQSIASRTGGSSTGMTMFRHKTLNFFWCGDGGFLANPAPNGFPKHGATGDASIAGLLWGHEGHHLPFATTNDNMPVVYSYGQTTARKRDIYNSYLFGNLMAWAVEQALNNGINKN